VLDSADNVEQLLDKSASIQKIHATSPDSEQVFSFMIAYFADTPTGFLGRDDGTEDGSGGEGRGGKDGMKDAVACVM